MKKVIAVFLLLALGMPAQAHDTDWIAPAIIGGIIGYNINRPYYPRPNYGYGYGGYGYPQPQFIYTPPAVIYPVPPMGTIPSYGYHYENFWDYSCGCYRRTLVPNY